MALLVTLCLAAFAVYLYVAVAHILTADQDHVLRVQAHQIAATYDFQERHRGGGGEHRGPGQHVHGRAATVYPFCNQALTGP